jgi:hypothetical protein
MARRPPTPKPAQPPADISPFDVGEDDEVAGGGVPDDDGWIHLDSTEEAPSDGDEKPKRKSARRRS